MKENTAKLLLKAFQWKSDEVTDVFITQWPSSKRCVIR